MKKSNSTVADLFKSKSEFYDHEHEITNNINKRASERKKTSQKTDDKLTDAI